ncbi:MAG TPA: hypothetical protein VGN22_21515 [Pseudonocardia sp.]
MAEGDAPVIDPDGLHDPRGFGYSHIARLPGGLVLVAGQFASDADGHVGHWPTAVGR